MIRLPLTGRPRGAAFCCCHFHSSRKQVWEFCLLLVLSNYYHHSAGGFTFKGASSDDSSASGSIHCLSNSSFRAKTQVVFQKCVLWAGKKSRELCKDHKLYFYASVQQQVKQEGAKHFTRRLPK